MWVVHDMSGCQVSTYGTSKGVSSVFLVHFLGSDAYWFLLQSESLDCVFCTVYIMRLTEL